MLPEKLELILIVIAGRTLVPVFGFNVVPSFLVYYWRFILTDYVDFQGSDIGGFDILFTRFEQARGKKLYLSFLNPVVADIHRYILLAPR